MNNATRWAMLGAAVAALVIVPFILYGEAMDARVSALLAAADRHRAAVAWALGGLLAADIVLPVPSSVVSVGCGATAGFAAGVAVSWAGMTLGCMIGYAVGRFAARGAVARLMGQRNMDRLSALTARHGLWALLLTRPVPVLAEAAVLFAGLARLRWPAFLALSGAANLALSILYAAIGSFAVTTAGFVVAFVAALAAPALFILGLSRLERSREKPR